ncbi:hypothetical protein DL98DRAFT_656150 [Cadophora sp. DSE1049]|nr:hypothetical protein DL98DRAFT_656150 [Cadophora sp. DSE1049]
MQFFAAPGLASVWALRGGKTCASTFTSISIWRWASRRIVTEIRSARQISSTSSTPSREGFEVQKFDVKNGSAGSITVDVYNPSALSNPSNPLVIHLPPTGTHLRSTHPAIPPYLLTPNTTLASINYHWNIPSSSTNSSLPKPLSSNLSYAHHPFPTPLHDILAGYTFLLSTLLPRYSPQSPSSSPTATNSNSSHNTRQSLYAPTRPLPIQRPIVIYGSFLGGTLATSLALTENFTSRSLPTKVIGLITKNAVFDWTDVATSPPPPPLPNDSSSEPELDSNSRLGQSNPEDGWDSNILHELKKQLFASPASAFDSFASPTLFFRTSGLAIPQTWVTEEDSSTDSSTANSLSPSEAEDHWPSEEGDLSPVTPALNEKSSSDSPSIASNQDAVADLAKRISKLYIEPPSRPAHLKFPPSSSPNLKIPFSLFMYTSSPSPPSPSSSLTFKSSPKTKPKPKSQKKTHPSSSSDAEGATSPASQAKQMASLLRRSVFVHEFSERKIWDEDLDPEGASEARCRIVALSPEGEGRRSSGKCECDGEAGAVGQWLDELIT